MLLKPNSYFLTLRQVSRHCTRLPRSSLGCTCQSLDRGMPSDQTRMSGVLEPSFQLPLVRDLAEALRFLGGKVELLVVSRDTDDKTSNQALT